MKKAFRFLYNIEQYLLEALLVLMGITILVQIASRYLFNNPLIFTEELASLCFIWMTMLGSGFCIKNKLNTRITILVDRLPPFWKKASSILTDLLCMAMFLFLLPTGIRFNASQARVQTAAMQLPMTVIYSSFLVATALISIRFAIDIVETISGQPLVKEEDS